MLNTEPEHLAIDFEEIVQLKEGSAANADNSDPIVVSGKAELALRRIIARYGFGRMPLTYGELYGLLDYCDELDSGSGIGLDHLPNGIESWQASALITFERHQPHLIPALELYCAGDIEALRELHRRDDTLTQIGKTYRQFEE